MKMTLDEVAKVAAEGLGWHKDRRGLVSDNWLYWRDERGHIVVHIDAVADYLLGGEGAEVIKADLVKRGYRFQHVCCGPKAHSFMVSKGLPYANNFLMGQHANEKTAILIAYVSMLKGEQIELEEK